LRVAGYHVRACVPGGAGGQGYAPRLGRFLRPNARAFKRPTSRSPGGPARAGRVLEAKYRDVPAPARFPFFLGPGLGPRPARRLKKSARPGESSSPEPDRRILRRRPAPGGERPGAQAASRARAGSDRRRPRRQGSAGSANVPGESSSRGRRAPGRPWAGKRSDRPGTHLYLFFFSSFFYSCPATGAVLGAESNRRSDRRRRRPGSDEFFSPETPPARPRARGSAEAQGRRADRRRREEQRRRRQEEEAATNKEEREAPTVRRGCYRPVLGPGTAAPERGAVLGDAPRL
jgi:hypothetical protein